VPSKTDPPADPDRYEQAIAALRRRVPMTDPEFRKLEEDERQKAFWVAGVTQARLVQEAKDAIERAVAEGTSLDDFKADVGGELAEAWGGEDAARLETVFRTNVMGAYNAGRSEIFSDPVVREARPYLRFDTAGDARVTEDICEPCDGVILPADHPWWATHTPPLHYSCRSILVPLSQEEAEQEGITASPPAVQPLPGFGRPSSSDTWEPDAEGLDKDVAKVLRDQLDE